MRWRVASAAAFIAGFLGIGSAESACTIPMPPNAPPTTAPLIGIYTNDRVLLKGGCIDGIVIGSNKPAAGYFTNIFLNGVPLPGGFMATDASNAGLPEARTNLGASVSGGIWPGSLGGTGINNSGTITLGGNLVTGGALTIANLATVNQLVYVTSSGNIGGLATGNSGVLVTSGAGVPSISTTLPAGLTIPGYLPTGILPGSSGGTGVNNASTITVGGNFITNGALNIANLSTVDQLLRVTSSGNVGGLGTGNNGVLVTSGSGVPSISTTLPVGLTVPGYTKTVQAVCANAAGDGAIIQTAVDTGRPVHIVGPCVGDTTIVVHTPGQEIYGDGRVDTVITVSSVVAGAGTFQCAIPQTTVAVAGPTFRNLGIVFTQVNTNLRASLTNFKPAFSCSATGRGRMSGVRVSEAMVGVDIRGQSGGWIISDLEISCLSVCIWVDGSADTIVLDRLHIWPFGAELVESGDGCAGTTPTRLCALYGAINNTGAIQTTTGILGPIGIASGRADDLKISNSLFLIGLGISFFTGVSDIPGPTFGTISNIDMDTYGGIIMDGGNISASSYFSSTVISDFTALLLTRGDFRCSSCRFKLSAHGGTGSPQIIMSGAASDNDGASVSLSNVYFEELVGAGENFIYATGGGTLNVNGMQVNALMLTGGSPIICASCDGSTFVTANISGVQPTNAVTSRTMISTDTDVGHRIYGNGLKTGWANVCPATQTNMRSGLNGGAGNTTCN